MYASCRIQRKEKEEKANDEGEDEGEAGDGVDDGLDLRISYRVVLMAGHSRRGNKEAPGFML